MRLLFDPETDSLTIHLIERPGTDSDEVADGVVLDFDEAAWSAPHSCATYATFNWTVPNG